MTKFFARWPSGREVTFRSLTWAEFQTFERALRHRSPADVYLSVYRAVVLEGPPEADLTAGIVEFVGRTLTDHNPFNGKYEDVKRALDLKRGELRQDYLVAAKAVIASLFQVSLAEINSWDAEQFFEYVAMAEFVSGRKLEPGEPARPAATRPPSSLPVPERQPQTQPLERGRDRDQPTEAPRLRRPLTAAQQIVVDRVRGPQPQQR